MSRHAHVLYFIATNPGSTVTDIAGGLAYSRSAAFAIVRDLRKAGLVNAGMEGRRHHYAVNLDARAEIPGLQTSIDLGTALAVFQRAGVTLPPAAP